MLCQVEGETQGLVQFGEAPLAGGWWGKDEEKISSGHGQEAERWQRG